MKNFRFFLNFHLKIFKFNFLNQLIINFISIIIDLYKFLIIKIYLFKSDFNF